MKPAVPSAYYEEKEPEISFLGFSVLKVSTIKLSQSVSRAAQNMPRISFLMMGLLAFLDITVLHVYTIENMITLLIPVDVNRAKNKTEQKYKLDNDTNSQRLLSNKEE